MTSVDFDLTNIMANFASRVGAMEGTIKTFMDNWAQQDRLAHEGRRLLYERIDMLSKQVDRIATDVLNVQQDIAEMKKEIEEEITPTIESVEQRKERALGAKGVWAIIAGAIVAAFSAITYIADKVIAHVWPKI